jgi:hypothetical protein
MIRSALLLILLLCSSGLQAQEQPEPAEPQPAGPVVQEPAAQEPAPPKAPGWPLPFQPSEQVGADSQISFPTDI